MSNTTAIAAPVTVTATGAPLSEAHEGVQSFPIATDAKAAALLCPDGARLVTYDQRKPTKASATLTLPATAWDNLEEVPETYRGLLVKVLDSAAKALIKAHLSNYTVWPSHIPCHVLSPEAILAQAVDGASDWLTTEELTAAWEASATRAAFIGNPNYAANRAYRAAVDSYKELVLKLAARNPNLKPEQLDTILAKLAPNDLESELGGFVIRRIDALRNRKVEDNTADIMALL